ncbi:MFS family permease [Chitinophaga terrae (ex Kim and Jung 2007)]|uniref:MFS transporter n=1 Tax=Chitinophaga terrae (ex Kim and Jung 2007) TaxID=408074 RepID=UPI002789D0A1|nr:MFS transporter [Chitinophaga terrae (ex Kim and Jung 2007)]MDQ0108698.1 MFS family permease [Chitinophaga terrae (ex Kim and Jung 2007)]
MLLTPEKTLSEAAVKRGMRLVIGDGLAAEMMITLTGGAFLVAMALLMGANNLQIGLLAALPTFTNVFQLISVWLVRRTNNRRAVAVYCNLLARIPLLLIGLIPLIWPRAGNIHFLLIFLSLFYFFGSLAGPSWNAWMKDLIPEAQMGVYFARRSSYTQALNVVLSLAAAFGIDYIRQRSPNQELTAYYWMFVLAGVAGIVGAFILAGAPEPAMEAKKDNLFKLLQKPFRDQNFLRLLWFSSAWVFAVNIATPFFTVFMMKGMGLSLSYITVLLMISQLTGVFTFRVWGVFADRYSNKTILAISGPMYVLTLLCWCFVGIYSNLYANLALLVLIHIVTGIANAGITLSTTNIGLKLAPSMDAVVYLTSRNIISAVFSAIAPLCGGYIADYFESRRVTIDATFAGPHYNKVLHLLDLHQWNFLFLISAILTLLSLELLFIVQEKGEVNRNTVVRIMRTSIRGNLKDAFLIGNLINLHDQFKGFIIRRKPG